MVDTTGQLHLFDKASLAELRVENKSLMPDDYARRLTAPEIQNLVAYLKTLTGSGLSKPLEVSIPGGLTSERIANAQAEPQNWLSYWGDLQGRHYSSLSQIDFVNPLPPPNASPTRRPSPRTGSRTGATCRAGITLR